MRAHLGLTSVARLRTKPPLSTSSIVGMSIGLTFLLGSCTGDSITDLLETAEESEGAGTAAAVRDLAVALTTDSAITVRWTQVDDGFGAPARYFVRYASPAIHYASATDACELAGDQIGGELTCTIDGLEPGRAYDVQLVSTTAQSDSWFGGAGSNVATGQTTAARPDSTVADDPDTPGDPHAPDGGSIGMWITRAEIAALPMSGAAWRNLLSAGSNGCGRVDLSDQEQSTNVCILAKALLFARTQDMQYRSAVIGAIRQIVAAPKYNGRALALGRELGAYVIAADLVNLEEFDPRLDELFRVKLVTLRTTYTSGAASSLVDCHEKRPNNWGAHCGATRAAIAVYLGDAVDLARTAQVFKGYLGDRSSYAGFEFGGPENDLSWQCDRRRPVGINPKGCARKGLSLDGVLPDDQRRGGSFRTSPPKENYVWEALQGLIAQAVILHRAGYPVWDWEDRALLRAVSWLYDVVGYPAEGDDTWQPHVINRHYSTTFSAATPSKAGKNVGWTDWTH